jgi:hypothetical protein
MAAEIAGYFLRGLVTQDEAEMLLEKAGYASREMTRIIQAMYYWIGRFK